MPTKLPVAPALLPLIETVRNPTFRTMPPDPTPLDLNRPVSVVELLIVSPVIVCPNPSKMPVRFAIGAKLPAQPDVAEASISLPNAYLPLAIIP